MCGFIFVVVAGKFGVFVLDANESATKFKCSIADDFEMFKTAEDFYVGAAYEESCVWTLQGIQRNLVGMLL